MIRIQIQELLEPETADAAVDETTDQRLRLWCIHAQHQLGWPIPQSKQIQIVNNFLVSDEKLFHILEILSHHIK